LYSVTFPAPCVPQHETTLPASAATTTTARFVQKKIQTHLDKKTS
jgi:hypothetical protein